MGTDSAKRRLEFALDLKDFNLAHQISYWIQLATFPSPLRGSLTKRDEITFQSQFRTTQEGRKAKVFAVFSVFLNNLVDVVGKKERLGCVIRVDGCACQQNYFLDLYI